MGKIFNKLFSSGDWQVALFDKGNIQEVKNPSGYWLADPFIVKKDNIIYLFAEAFEKKKELGRIGFFSSNDNYSNMTILLEKKYHLSFPNVFMLNGKYYMIPESSENTTIDLYCFEEFPNDLQFVATILKGDYVDTSIIKIFENSITVASYNNRAKKLIFLSFDLITMECKILNEINDELLVLRPAGNAFEYNKMILMPFQNCKEKYGQDIIIKRIELMNERIEVFDYSLNLLNYLGIPLLAKVDRFHTLNFINSKCFVVDYMIEKKSLFKPFKMFKRKIRRYFHQKKAKNYE